jgi:CheY-like chemotaxis protein
MPRMLDILVVDDNCFDRAIAKFILERDGHAVYFASSGKDVLGALEDNIFDMVLIDWQMPGLDGCEATIMIREDDNISGSHVPIVAVTDHRGIRSKRKWLQSGIDESICKPYMATTLIPIINKCMIN